MTEPYVAMKQRMGSFEMELEAPFFAQTNLGVNEKTTEISQTNSSLPITQSPVVLPSWSHSQTMMNI